MSAFGTVKDVGLTGGTPRFAPLELRSELHIRHPVERTALLAFGGLGLDTMPYDRIAARTDWCFLAFDEGAPDLPNVVQIPKRSTRPLDVMPICGRVIGKPGYSTFSEAARLGVPIVTFPRPGFAEAQVLVDGVADHCYHQILDRGDFFTEPWHFLDGEPDPPNRGATLGRDGSETVAQEIVSFLAG
jgi:hypothetical protein